ncbi:MAG TPA: hypothetical protein VN706_16505 [Gemmatimonadaceae bacterium]|nr:hypothetical protein [Gemmatimonadaceae bacterium]
MRWFILTVAVICACGGERSVLQPATPDSSPVVQAQPTNPIEGTYDVVLELGPLLGRAPCPNPSVQGPYCTAVKDSVPLTQRGTLVISNATALANPARFSATARFDTLAFVTDTYSNGAPTGVTDSTGVVTLAMSADFYNRMYVSGRTWAPDSITGTVDFGNDPYAYRGGTFRAIRRR